MTCAKLCSCVGNLGCLPTDHTSEHSKNLRNAKIKTAVVTAFACLAVLTVILGAVSLAKGTSLAGAASGVASNALWITVAGGLALALLLIALAGQYCRKSHPS